MKKESNILNNKISSYEHKKVLVKKTLLVCDRKLADIKKDVSAYRKNQKLINKIRSINEINFINKQNQVISTSNMKSSNENSIELKHFPSSVREWNNSIYLYNKNNINLIPFTTIHAMKLIKSFFNLYNKDLEKKIRSKRLLLRLRRLSSNKIYLSNGEFKHTNNNVSINMYIFNKQKYNYLSKLEKTYLESFLTKKNINNALAKLLKSIYIKGFNSIKEVNQNRYSLIRALNIIENNHNYKINIFNNISNYTTNFYKNIIDLTIDKIRLYFLYKQLIYINKSKLNYTYLRLLKKHLEDLYNKNVEFNLINLKRFYLNSDILFESAKLKLTRNKQKMRQILNKLKDKVKIHKKKHYLGTNIIINNKPNKIDNEILLKKVIFNHLKYKHITGFRLEAKGRLSKRYTASRSVHKLKYKGNLLNIDSSYRGLSSVILKGNLKSNLQHTKLESKTRIGSFGIKGWISSN